MGQPGSLGNLTPGGDDYIVRKLRDLERQIVELRTARSLESATIGKGGITVKGGGSIKIAGGGDLTIDGGDMIVDDGEARSGNFVHGSTGWRLLPTGNVEFNDITLRGGIIGDDALENPVSPIAAHADTSGFAVPLVQAAIVTKTITVPAGFTRALVMASATLAAYNSSGAGDDLNLFVDIASATSGFVVYEGANAGALACITHSPAAVLSGLGSSFQVRALVSTQIATWPSTAGNVCNLDVLALFLR